MNNKILLLLIAACIVLAYFGLSEGERKKGSSVVEDPKPFADLDLNAVDRIVLKQGKETLSLEPVDGVWRSKTGDLDYPADFPSVRDTIMEVRDVILVSRLATSRAHDEHFGLDPEAEPLTLELMKGETLLAGLELGKGRPGRPGSSPFGFTPDQGQYARLMGLEDVYELKDKLMVSTRASTWMKSTLAKAEKEEITKVEVMSFGRNLVFEKSVEKMDAPEEGAEEAKEMVSWKATADLLDANAIDSESLDSWLDQFTEIRVTEPVSSSRRQALQGADTFSVTISGGESALYSIEMAQDGDDWLVWEKDQPEQIYKIASFRLDDFFGENDEIFQLEDVTISANVAQMSWEELTIRHDGEQWVHGASGKQPSIDQDKANGAAVALEKLETFDVLSKLDRPVQGMLRLKGGLVVEDLGEAPIKSGGWIKAKGRVYLIPAAAYGKIFPKRKDLVSFESLLDRSDGLASLDFGEYKLENKEGEWALGGQPTRAGSQQAWEDAYRTVYESPYAPSGTVDEPKLLLKIRSDKDQNEVLRIGEAARGIAPVSSSLYDGIFQVNLDVVRALHPARAAFEAEAAGPSEGP